MTVALPKAYAWLDAIDVPPKMIVEARALYGVLETPGNGDNATIMGWARELGLSKVYSHDSIPWCGLFAAYICLKASKPVPAAPLWALNWAKWADDGGQPDLGDILVFVRPGGGHVGLYVGEDSQAYHVMGGNTHDAVSIARIDKHRLYAVRQPHYTTKPASARPHVLSATGSLSDNEA